MKKTFTLYYNKVTEQGKNNMYPYSKSIHSLEDLKEVMVYDHVCAEYKDNKRSKQNFIRANCSMFDVDNTHSENPDEWITPKAIQEKFPNVPFYVSYSRNHNKQKGDKAARPKFHIYFPVKEFTDSIEYEAHKNSVCMYFTKFDPNAKDVARFFFGVQNPTIEYFNGEILLSDFMKTKHSDTLKDINTTKNNQFVYLNKENEVIPEGMRNSSLFKFAINLLKQYGNIDGEIYEKYIAETEKCSPKLDDKEINDIWKSAYRYYQNNRVNTYKPKDYTDVGQAEVFVEKYGSVVRFSLATKYLFYTGKVWTENSLKVHRLVQSLTEEQLRESVYKLNKAQKTENESAINGDDVANKKTKEAIKQAEKYRNFALKSRDTLRIKAVLKETAPMVEIDVSKLDSDGFMLNTPDGIVDLRTKELHQHKPTDYCTKITNASPSSLGAELFDDFIKIITCNDDSLAEYLQLIAGMCAIGKVFNENLVIACGRGRNGKSTFLNLLVKVLGDYSGNLSAETLTSNSRKNKSFEIAELRGKRIVLATELEEDRMLDTAIVKKLCSTDRIFAEKKYKDPFDFEPSHTLILVTNHLPRVFASDDGTWRRLIVIPFNATISKNDDMRNYAEYLYEKAGGAVLSWIIDGAYKFIKSHYKISMPEIVKQVTKDYRDENDWLHNFTSECCEFGRNYEQASGELYKSYREYCKNNGEPAHSSSSFKKALIDAGFNAHKNNKGNFFYGLRLVSNTNYFSIPFVNPRQVMEGDIENQTQYYEDIEF